MIGDAPVLQLEKIKNSRAVLYSTFAQGWTAFAGLISITAAARFLDPQEQGYYYTFTSLVALQVFVELGIANVIVQVASHEAAMLSPASGLGASRALSRLASLLRFAVRWYAISGVTLVIGLGIGGATFFAQKHLPPAIWLGPWLSTCVLTGVTLVLAPFISVLEGCNHVASVAGFRLVQAVFSTLVGIVCLSSGCGLYALPASIFTRALCASAFIFLVHRQMWVRLLAHPIVEAIGWRREVWPFQWRIAVSWVCGYFIFTIFTPIMFSFHGPAVAGQMGMTLSIVAAVDMLASPWINTRIPTFGMMIARGDYATLDRHFARTLVVALVMCLIGSVLVLCAVFTLHATDSRMSERLLPPAVVLVFVLQRVINFVINAVAVYLRAHKREPLLWPTVITAVLACISTVLLGGKYGPLGAGLGFLAVTLVWSLPTCLIVFREAKLRWHAAPASA